MKKLCALLDCFEWVDCVEAKVPMNSRRYLVILLLGAACCKVNDSG